jgi:outer membrane lipoprotein-sorting protein
MRKIFILLSLIIPLTLLCNAQTRKAEEQAKIILEKTSEKMQSYKNIKIEFTYKMKNEKENINESKDGIILIKGDKYNLDIAGQNVICNGKTIWTYIKDADEVQINVVEDNDESINPVKILTSYDKNYKPKLIREGHKNDKTVYVIDLTPLEGKSFYKIRLIIDKTKKQILKSTIYDKNGSLYLYIVKKFITDITIKDSNFTFDKSKHPDVEVIDMR